VSFNTILKVPQGIMNLFTNKEVYVALQMDKNVYEPGEICKLKVNLDNKESAI